MTDIVTIAGIAILLSLTGCDFPDSLILGLLAVIYYHIKILRMEE